MRDLRIEVVDDGNGIYVAANPDGVWARSSEVDETITADWDAQGRLIGLELAGSSARAAVDGLVRALVSLSVDDRDRLLDAVTALGLDVPGVTADDGGRRRRRSATPGRRASRR